MVVMRSSPFVKSTLGTMVVTAVWCRRVARSRTPPIPRRGIILSWALTIPGQTALTKLCLMCSNEQRREGL